MSPAEEDALVLATLIRMNIGGEYGEDIAIAIRAAVAAQKEADAKVCEQIGKDIVCPEECAAAIREGTK